MQNNKSKNIINKPYATVVALPYPSAPVAPVPLAAPAAPVENNTEKSSITNDASKELQEQGFTKGLIQSISQNKDVFPSRIWVVDNSGSMTTADGHRLHQTSSNSVKLLDCTRWAEIQNTVAYHARMAALLEAPTSFRLLNPTYRKDVFGVAERGREHIQEDLREALSTIREVSPCGVTPLSERVREIAFTIETMKVDLFSKGQKVVIVLATDGLPSDKYGESTEWHLKDFKNALQSLEGLPVWVVIRLCTDDEDVVEFYNNIDSHLEISLDVLDDFLAEAIEVYEHNKWLNYALPLHRMREMGFYHKLFDLIDERPMTRDELKDFFQLLYGADVLDGLPDPQVDWPKFLDRIATVTKAQKMQWNPIKKKFTPWVDIRRLDYEFGNTATCCFF